MSIIQLLNIYIYMFKVSWMILWWGKWWDLLKNLINLWKYLYLPNQLKWPNLWPLCMFKVLFIISQIVKTMMVHIYNIYIINNKTQRHSHAFMPILLSVKMRHTSKIPDNWSWGKPHIANVCLKGLVLVTYFQTEW